MSPSALPMEARLLTLCFFCLLAPGSSLPLDVPPDSTPNFIRMLLLSRYGVDPADYIQEPELENSLETWGYDRSNPFHPFRQAVEKFAQDGTTGSETKETDKVEDSSISTASPDVLASMPPVTPDKGQKEYVMLRPPVDNQHKFEHWMQSMANGMMVPDQIVITKRKSDP